MENHISEQTVLLGISALSGVCAALVYDVVSTLRRRCARPWLTHVLDGLYALGLLAGLAVFTRRWGGGELRLFMVLGLLGGAGLYFLLPASWLHPLWEFWADTLQETASLLLLPLRVLRKGLKKFYRLAKKHFLFFGKYAKIKRYKWEFILIHRRGGFRGGRHYREKSKSGKERKQFHRRAGAGGADRRAGH